jgi:hypothetical protein
MRNRRYLGVRSHSDDGRLVFVRSTLLRSALYRTFWNLVKVFER